ncbi:MULTISPECIES: hypothetical protein [Shewanella]|nr:MULTISPECIES: hypothetical protein [Shewanella]MCT8871581.1 hypothetical protein [Shewanella xiamenensis]UWH43580.1 hypothetical protein KXJ80_10250 [Shewanella xiamenensis]
MIKLELTEKQFEALSKKKLADVVTLCATVDSLKQTNPAMAPFLDKFLSNETIEVIYNGGSNAGKPRKLILQNIKPDGAFTAFCIDSDASKSFKLEKVELID